MREKEAIRVYERLMYDQCRDSLPTYLHNVRINSYPKSRPFGEAAEPWQRELIAPKIPAIEFVAGLNPSYNGPLSFMTILPRGHDKSSLEGRLCSWLLIACRRPCPIYVVAADRDQGRLIIQAMEDEAKLNPWLYKHLTFKNDVITGPGGRLEVLPADARSAYGLRGRFYIFDEWTHWHNEEMSTAILSGAEKVPGTVVVILSNAGYIGSWQHEQRIAAARKKDWCIFERQGMFASWMSWERIKDKAELLPPLEARRVFYNEWIDPSVASGYLLPTEIEGCASLGRGLNLRYMLRREPGITNYVAACDFGARKDRTVCVVAHRNKDGDVIVDRMDVFQGSPETPLHPNRVYDWCIEVSKSFNPREYVIDPHELEGTILDLEKRGLNIWRFTGRGGKDNMELASNLRAMIVAKKLLWYPGCGQQQVVRDGRPVVDDLETELRGLVVVKKQYGWRFDHESGRHDDKAVAVGMAALAAIKY